MKLGASDYHGFELDKEIEHAMEPGAKCRLDSNGVEGDPQDPEVIRLTFHCSGSYRSQKEYLVDLEVGAIPREMTYTIHYRDSPPKISDSHVYYSDIRHVADRGWFPFLQTIVQSASSSGSRFVKRLIVEEADFEHRPDPSVFRMEFPEPRVMINAAAMERYPAQAVWDLDRLPSLGKPGVERITLASPGPPAPTLPGEREPGRWWVALALLAGLLLAATSVFYSWRRRHA